MAEDDRNKLEKLKLASDEAFVLYPKSCSHAVWYVIKQYNPDQPYLVANDLVEMISSSPDWEEVSLSELSALANRGTLVVGGAKERVHGHVITVYPGDEKPRGGYFFLSSKSGKTSFMREDGMYARAMSTSRGGYAGAISKGDKTVRDPWGGLAFKEVRFWKFVGKNRDNADDDPLSLTTRWERGARTITQIVIPTRNPEAIKRWRLESDPTQPILMQTDIHVRWQR
ncbi:hypothetical protein [Geomesophilobacter sediminis]|uniref:Uncharacterized protein n=1 Tax=Geomesophilobacter sediminis TaxID=2798584 RepID=A0A8J7LV45_9BACT|nr:hypothetical protein [Geomesophilobacter sediminis]MBJ6724525.1 hypothetical protein [Geomesophilobacter sediminis]